MSLEKEIADRSQEISTDAYAMSVGELVSMYRDGELDIHPEFQRFFRWTDAQKTAFIESLLLGIPIPSIFVAETSSGTWDVIDGLQRISTVLQLMGELKDQDGNRVPPLRLRATRYLPSLQGMVWTAEKEGDIELPQVAKLKIKRARFDIKIILNTSDTKSKYELFQRLNTGGSIATDQEVRNCILIMVNREFYHWLNELRNNKDFQACLPLTDRQLSEQYDMELATRFIVLRRIELDGLSKIEEVGSFLTDEIIKIAEDPTFDRDEAKAAFEKTFSLLASTLGEDSFKRFDLEKNRPVGPFLISMFEIVALGIGYHCLTPGYSKSYEQLVENHMKIWENPRFTSGTGSGVRASSRIPLTIPLGRTIYAP
ncbi:DUF262 domain-containing protein [Symbiobacterium thermophilum]|nr:DUF262 domain-containing protein [Symbiobacterium thermophilum]